VQSSTQSMEAKLDTFRTLSFHDSVVEGGGVSFVDDDNIEGGEEDADFLADIDEGGKGDEEIGAREHGWQ